MPAGTRGSVGRRGNNDADQELSPPPTMAEVLNNIETNRLRNERLLELVAQNTERRPDDCVTLGDFIRSFPPIFTHSKEPLEADDWLRAIERKFSALRVRPTDRVNFATYQLEGEAGVWWEGFLNLQDRDMLLPGKSLLQHSVPLISLSPSWISKGGSFWI